MRIVALVLVGGVAAGCSSGVSRFTADDLFTGSTNNQRSVVRNDTQPYPADVVRPQSAAGQYSYSRAAVEPAPVAAPVQRSSLPPPSAPAPARIASAPVPAQVDRTPTGTINAGPAIPPRHEPVQDGWSAEGGRLVTLKQGETLATLSDRYGVPVKAIVNVNGFESAASVRSGQRVIIPVYNYARLGSRSAAPANQTEAIVPERRPAQPSKAPVENVAVLPQQPKLREKAPEAQASSGISPAAPNSGRGVYTVVSGDTLYGVARKTGVSAQDLRSANGLDKSAMLRIGQKLTIPAGGQQVAAAPKAVDPVVTGTAGTVKPPVAPAKKAEPEKLATYTPPKRTDIAIKQAEASSNEEAPDATGIGKMRWPVRGRVVSSFSGGSDGIDISVPEGTPVKAAENGVVIFAGEGLKDFGKTVLLRHADGKVTVYGHAGEIMVKRGDNVRRGQEIARSGMSGNTDAPKLHFEVRENSNPVDPQKYLE